MQLSLPSIEQEVTLSSEEALVILKNEEAVKENTVTDLSIKSILAKLFTDMLVKLSFYDLRESKSKFKISK